MSGKRPMPSLLRPSEETPIEAFIRRAEHKQLLYEISRRQWREANNLPNTKAYPATSQQIQAPTEQHGTLGRGVGTGTASGRGDGDDGVVGG